MWLEPQNSNKENSYSNISDNTTNIAITYIILNILNYIDEFIAYKNKLLIKAYKKTNILYSYIKELIIVLIQTKLVTRPSLRSYYITIDP